MAKIALKSIFVVISAKDEFRAYCKTIEDAKIEVGEEEECKILEVVRIIEGYYPPEPELEFLEVGLDSVL